LRVERINTPHCVQVASLGRWPVHQPQRITMSHGKLCPVHRSFFAMSGRAAHISILGCGRRRTSIRCLSSRREAVKIAPGGTRGLHTPTTLSPSRRAGAKPSARLRGVLFRPPMRPTSECAGRTEGHRLDGQSLADYFYPSQHNNPQKHFL
jgi:hypothetical protein